MSWEHLHPWTTVLCETGPVVSQTGLEVTMESRTTLTLLPPYPSPLTLYWTTVNVSKPRLFRAPVQERQALC